MKQSKALIIWTSAIIFIAIIVIFIVSGNMDKSKIDNDNLNRNISEIEKIVPVIDKSINEKNEDINKKLVDKENLENYKDVSEMTEEELEELSKKLDEDDDLIDLINDLNN